MNVNQRIATRWDEKEREERWCLYTGGNMYSQCEYERKRKGRMTRNDAIRNNGEMGC